MKKNGGALGFRDAFASCWVIVFMAGAPGLPEIALRPSIATHTDLGVEALHQVIRLHDSLVLAFIGSAVF